uniref:Uncharacterized protein n=1 Tax=Oryza sativa subsp. japonica TaxID=39947 RepID=Q6K381_ORYSJ|nr:hypothetical protein [Oryza sativa Japonica Group]
MEGEKGVLIGARENGVRVAICRGEVVAVLAFETVKPVEGGREGRSRGRGAAWSDRADGSSGAARV